jgi:carbamoyltransferase
MLLVAPVLDGHRVPVTEVQRETMQHDPDLRNRVNVPRSSIPAVTHVDYSARLQTVDAGRNPRLAALLRAFHQRTGVPVLVNTSFNVRGEPIVCTPQDAYRCFIGTEMDALVLEDVVLLKEDVAGKMDAATREKYLAQFQLD